MALIHLTKENFDEIVENNSIIVIDFWAEWCGPCKAYGPVFEKIANEYPDITFGKVDTEEEQELAGYFQIRSIPTTFIIREQIVVFSQPGALPEEALRDVINQVKELDMDQVRKEMGVVQQ